MKHPNDYSVVYSDEKLHPYLKSRNFQNPFFENIKYKLSKYYNSYSSKNDT